MCTRFFIEPNPEQQTIAAKAKESPLAERITVSLSRPLCLKGEIHPTDLVPVIATTPKGTQGVYPMIFGFSVPGIDHPLLNARSETADRKELWSECLLKRRCAIPASYYFEWEHLTKPGGLKATGEKYMMQTFGSAMTWLAGIYRIEEFRGIQYPAFVILTRKPGAELLKLHDRMPVVLPREEVPFWIRPDSNPQDILKHAITSLVIEKAG